MRLLGVVVELMKRSWTCLSCQNVRKVKKLSKVEKLQKLEKSAKVIGLEELSFLTSDSRLAFTKMGSSRTHNGGLLAIIEIFKDWGPYQLQAQNSCCHQLYLWQFKDTKNSNSRQICWALELSQYHFRFNYRQSKANGATDGLSRSPLEETDLTLLHQVFICGMPVLSLLFQSWRCASEEDV